MSWVFLSFVFILIWWLTWLIVLPIRIQSIYDKDESGNGRSERSLRGEGRGVDIGADRGAPTNPMILWRFGVTTVATSFIVLIFWVAMETGLIESLGGRFIDWVINFISE